MPKLMIVVSTPPDSVESVLDAIASAGGGTVGHYTHCAFTSSGLGRFMPDAAATPHTGKKGIINAVDEVRIESFCEQAGAKAVLHAIRTAHPYEEPVIYLIPVLDESDL